MAESVKIRPVCDADCDEVIKIFSHYTASGYAAYPDEPVRPDLFAYLCEGTFAFLIIVTDERVIGFGLTKPLLPFPAFTGTCTLTYFISPDYTGQGFGTMLLDHLTAEAKSSGISILIANMASKNEASVRFHKKHGFTEAGRFRNVGNKFGESFDVIWMQKGI